MTETQEHTKALINFFTNCIDYTYRDFIKGKPIELKERDAHEHGSYTDEHGLLNLETGEIEAGILNVYEAQTDEAKLGFRKFIIKHLKKQAI